MLRFLLSCAILPWRKPEGGTSKASFKFAFSFRKNFLIVNIAGFLPGFWSVHWRAFFVSPASSVFALLVLRFFFFFTCIRFHYLVFIKMTFFLLYGRVYMCLSQNHAFSISRAVCRRNLILISFWSSGGRQLHCKLENTASTCGILRQ